MESGPGECFPHPWNKSYIYLSKFFHPGNFDSVALLFAKLKKKKSKKPPTKNPAGIA